MGKKAKCGLSHTIAGRLTPMSSVADIELRVDGDNKLSPVHSVSHGAVDALPEEFQRSSASRGHHQVAAGGSIIESMLQQKEGSQRYLSLTSIPSYGCVLIYLIFDCS